MAITAGSTVNYKTENARRRGTVVAIGGGFAVVTLALVTTERNPNGTEKPDKIGPVDNRPYVLPVSALTEVV